MYARMFLPASVLIEASTSVPLSFHSNNRVQEAEQLHEAQILHKDFL
jgi:hypothetical protein